MERSALSCLQEEVFGRQSQRRVHESHHVLHGLRRFVMIRRLASRLAPIPTWAMPSAFSTSKIRRSASFVASSTSPLSGWRLVFFASPASLASLRFSACCWLCWLCWLFWFFSRCRWLSSFLAFLFFSIAISACITAPPRLYHARHEVGVRTHVDLTALAHRRRQRSRRERRLHTALLRTAASPRRQLPLSHLATLSIKDMFGYRLRHVGTITYRNRLNVLQYTAISTRPKLPQKYSSHRSFSHLSK